ncbi:MAG: alpha/beta fold hydrolase, partial [Anaerolineae bacterium]|nr:alpha/beta fold hydrolase [Anaerolineae bacterium]
MKRLSLLLVMLLAACSTPLFATPLAPAAGPPPQVEQVTVTPAPPTATPEPSVTPSPVPPSHTPTPTLHPLSIADMRARSYPGSDLVTVQVLDPGDNYARSIVSYQSEGLTIYALLTVPFGDPPPTGWPVVIFNHGYIPPDQYRTTERYVAYVDGFARAGYIVLRSDYRGHGDSQGTASGGYSTPDYTVDVLNAVASIKRFPGADPQRIGMWGHSMGGHITLRAMVTTQDIKAVVIWAGVTASYADMLARWRATPPASI